VLQVLDSTPASRGRELAAALVLREACSARWPAVAWQVQRVGAHGANFVARHAQPGPLLYSHLDTSVDRPDDVGPLRVSDETVDGFGVAVARGPAAAAVTAFAEARAGSLLLASSGTHRRRREAVGVSAWLATNERPSAAVVAKCGPRGVLWSEPGALYLTLDITGRSGVVMLPTSSVPTYGLPASLGPVLQAISGWCADYVAANPPSGQLGAAAGIGALTTGLPDKADLFPASAEIGLYVVTLPEASASKLADELLSRVDAVLPPGCSAQIVVDPVHEATITDPGAAIVRAACSAWGREFGPAPDLTGWTGSTDGVVFRGQGIDTVRLGPHPSSLAEDPRRDVLRLDELEAFVRVYRELLEVA
jgi:hypothetical protein